MSSGSARLLNTLSPSVESSFQDPYLSAPSDPEEESFRSAGIRLTPAANDAPTTARLGSGRESPVNAAAGQVDSLAVQPTYFQDFLSPAEELYSEVSGHTSPDEELFLGSFETELRTEQSQTWWPTVEVSPQQEGLRPPTAAYHPSGPSLQLLTPDPTNHSTPSASGSLQPQGVSLQSRLLQMPMLITNHSNKDNTLNVAVTPDSATSRSPKIKIERYSRGDSPEREILPANRRHSQSIHHLSPGGMNSASEPDDEEEEEEKEEEDMNDGRSPAKQPVSRASDGSWMPGIVTGQGGLDPSSRGNDYVPSPNEMGNKRQLEEKNEDIRSWSKSVSAANSDAEDSGRRRSRGRKVFPGVRPRAKSAGDRQDYFNLKIIPGPGILIDESSGDDYSDRDSDSGSTLSSPQSPPVSATHKIWENADDFRPSELENYSFPARQPFDVHPWRDGPTDETPRAEKLQPDSSNAAIMEYERRAKEMDNISRAATWGTRNLSDIDLASLMDKSGSIRPKDSAASPTTSKPSRRGSLLEKLRHQLSNKSTSQATTIETTNQKHEPVDARKYEVSRPSITRKFSIGRPTSPSLSTSSALVAMTGQMAAIGGTGAVSQNMTGRSQCNLKRGRARSDLPIPSSPGLLSLIKSHGGPPVGNIALSPLLAGGASKVKLGRGEVESNLCDDEDDDNDDDDDEEMGNEPGLTMDFPIPQQLPLPTYEGFKTQIFRLNPRLEPALLHRLAHEQVRRYKALVETNRKHRQAVIQGKCTAGSSCFAQGGKAKLGSRNSDSTYAQFQVSGHHEDGHNPATLPEENAIPRAQFPPGVPLPPVERLPAEFECPLCFKVKKFQKPSDWTKHVHEDIQPFTCTFPDCNEPKSFKRKADWVRHEGEKHRQLEWWACEFPECNHKCHRKDNFVQHLTREHKMPEVKIRKSKGRDSMAKSGGADEARRERELRELWHMVDRCRHESPKNPRNEPCRFCGNVCSSWKKLTVHLAKHMEQIAMPVLRMVEERPSALPTGASPMDRRPPLVTASPQPISPEDKAGVGQAEYSETPVNKSASEIASDFSNMHCSPTTVAVQSNELLPMSAAYHASASYPAPFHRPQPTTIVPGNAPGGIPSSSYSQLGVLNPQVGTQLATSMSYVPKHQNSASYPPPFNAIPNLNIPVSRSPYDLSVNTADITSLFDAQNSLHASPIASSNLVPPVAYETDYQGVVDMSTMDSASYSTQYYQYTNVDHQYSAA
ncbi:hypothetical protein ASPZODRAFT_133311 [Penicilliopsis zonata CBS 506.65]|uniref:C2H2-type domain-containing protein n=1 Tax=Penicilliopsis zonata CBS 506.65 TaxID=1073090 RepID=A0A1L9SGN5_9EURO|nr:hypothetical protein ASPZODRAFT_133311 [Penicilliopsis zonata CBS 506.65]OJJ46283.1 hypothetical protein ASPZODRAFT_133311 [Penicilliopsis zonata CBS 506.65]